MFQGVQDKMLSLKERRVSIKEVSFTIPPVRIICPTTRESCLNSENGGCLDECEAAKVVMVI